MSYAVKSGSRSRFYHGVHKGVGDSKENTGEGQMRYKMIGVMLACAMLSNCSYKAICYDKGEVVYHHDWSKDRATMPERFGDGWWKLPGKDKPEQISCETAMR